MQIIIILQRFKNEIGRVVPLNETNTLSGFEVLLLETPMAWQQFDIFSRSVWKATKWQKKFMKECWNALRSPDL